MATIMIYVYIFLQNRHYVNTTLLLCRGLHHPRPSHMQMYNIIETLNHHLKICAEKQIICIQGFF